MSCVFVSLDCYVFTVFAVKDGEMDGACSTRLKHENAYRILVGKT
jgi:hypothetical protein